MKNYYIQAVIEPNGISRPLNCGLWVQADNLAEAFIKFQEHYESEWSTGIMYTVVNVIELTAIQIL